MARSHPERPGNDRETPPGIFGSLDIRLGLGLLRLSIVGRPADLDAEAVIHFALNQGIRVLDTADSYSLNEKDLHYGEHLVRQSLRNWVGDSEEVRIVTKVGMTRPGGKWVPCGRPKHLRQSVDGSLQALGVERLFLLLLHTRDPRVPFEDTLAALGELQASGKVQHLGLCNVSPAELRQAERHFPVAAVQNELSVLNRKSAADGMLALTQQLGIPFLAHRPLGGYAKTARIAKDPILSALAQRHGTTPQELALAAVLDAVDHVIPLIGATRMQSVSSCIRAHGICLDVSDRTTLSIRHSFEASSPETAAISPSAASSSVRVLSTDDHGPCDQPEVVLLMGVQGSGKSELVKDYLAHGYARLNRDELGGKLDDLVPRMQQLLAGGQRQVVLDNTYPTRLSRAPVVMAATAFGVPVRCRHLNTPMSEARINVVLRMLAKYGMPLGPDEMNLFRKADPTLPPPIALDRWAAGFEPPSLDEGFSTVDEIPFVRRVDPTHTERGLLLDVDGTLRTTISGEIYPRHPDDVALLPGRREILSSWVKAGYRLFFISNQSGVASRRVAHEAVQAAMFRTAELLQVPITEIAYCPHPSRPVGCFCRKPMPGLGVYLMQRHRLSPEHLIMVGDMESDALFARGLNIQFCHADEFFSNDGPETA
ncbi:MAG: HAD-IIIA family hydrolase [Planctomycetota bacterium]|nr:HAD-IIIA family hydrolase [Planctomycetota bacterium]